MSDKKDLLQKLKNKKLYSSIQEGGTALISGDTIDASVTITNINRNNPNIPFGPTSLKTPANINTIQNLYDYVKWLNVNFSGLYATTATTTTISQQLVALQAQVAALSSGSGSGSGTGSGGSVTQANILSTLAAALGYQVDDTENRLITLNDLTGDNNGSFTSTDVSTALGTTPLAQFKHLPSPSYLHFSGGNRKTRKQRK